MALKNKHSRLLALSLLTLLLGRCSCQPTPPASQAPPSASNSAAAPATAPPSAVVSQDQVKNFLLRLTAPPQGITAPPQGVTAPPQGITAPPQGITAPPQGITAPPQTFSALTGRILLPRPGQVTAPPQGVTAPPQGITAPPQTFQISSFRLAASDLFDKAKLTLDDQELTGVIFHNRQDENGILSAQYFIPRLAEKTGRNQALRLVVAGQVLLKAPLPPLEEEATVTQDLTPATTAVAAIREQNPQLTEAEIRQSPRLNQVGEQVLATLAKPQGDVGKDPELLAAARQAAGEVKARPVAVTRVDLDQADLTLVAGQGRTLTAQARLEDGSAESAISWSSSDIQVAVVGSDGTVLAFKPGQATLRAVSLRDPSRRASLSVTVTPAAPVHEPVATLAVATVQPSQETSPRLVPDGSGGTIITWQDTRTGTSQTDIYAQRIDNQGKLVWAANGVPVTQAIAAQEFSQPIADGSGGVIVAWHDFRAAAGRDIYIQRIDKDGQPLWAANGLQLTAAAGHQDFPRLIPDGAGGAILAWRDSRSGAGSEDIYAQRIDQDGKPLWTPDGVPVISFQGSQQNLRLVRDQAGGAIIAWEDRRFGHSDIYAQRLSQDGQRLWMDTGVLLTELVQDQMQLHIIPVPSGGAIVAWQDFKDGKSAAYVQRLSHDGQALWGEPKVGLAVAASTREQLLPRLVSDGANGAILVWQDGQPSQGASVYSQRFGADGQSLWAAAGVRVASLAADQIVPGIIPDGAGGALVCWQDLRIQGTGNDLYAQRLDKDGKVLWNANGRPVATGPGVKNQHHMIPDGAGGALVVWADNRSGSFDIYEQHIKADGSL